MVTLTSYLVSTQVLTQVDGEWSLNATPESVAAGAPDGLREIVDEQLESLGSDEREALEVASVAGESFAVQVVAAALDIDAEELEKTCARLAESGQYIEESGVAEWPDGTVGRRFDFEHAAFRRILYSRLSPARRRQLHIRIAERTEAAFASDLDAQAARLAVHFEQGGDVARVRWDFWHYRQAIAMYTHVIELAPDDWRPHTYRGIRQASVREFEGAVRDLEVARELAPLNYDVSYYLGFVYFLNGRFEDAANEYLRCFELADDPAAQAALADNFRSCAIIAADVEWQVAMTDWAVRALRRAGRHDEAMQLLDAITPDMPIESNIHYYHVLLFYKGLKSAEELLSVGEDGPYRFETVGYGVANWYLIEGETDRAIEILEKCAVHPMWPGYGRIAAEVELVRLAEK